MSMVFKGGPDGIFEQINGLCPSKPLPIPLGLQRQDAARDLPVEAADSEVVPTQIRPSGYESMPWILWQVRFFSGNAGSNVATENAIYKWFHHLNDVQLPCWILEGILYIYIYHPISMSLTYHPVSISIYSLVIYYGYVKLRRGHSNIQPFTKPPNPAAPGSIACSAAPSRSAAIFSRTRSARPHRPRHPGVHGGCSWRGAKLEELPRDWSCHRMRTIQVDWGWVRDDWGWFRIINGWLRMGMQWQAAWWCQVSLWSQISIIPDHSNWWWTSTRYYSWRRFRSHGPWFIVL